MPVMAAIQMAILNSTRAQDDRRKSISVVRLPLTAPAA
jgi:hypothetical protein